MSFVGTRPEVTKYVKKYTKEMRATLLLPAGITSEASIQYKDEAELLDLGMNLTTAFTIFVKQAIREQGIPFEITRETLNSETDLLRIKT